MKIVLRSDSWRWFVIVVGLTAMVVWFIASIALVTSDNQTRAASEQSQKANQLPSSETRETSTTQQDTKNKTPHWYAFLGYQVTVQWVLAFLTALTLGAIARQAIVTAESVKQTERHFALLNAQWLDTDEFSCQPLTEFPTDPSVSIWFLRFKIVNNTPLVVTVTSIDYYFDGPPPNTWVIKKTIGPHTSGLIEFVSPMRDISRQAIMTNGPCGLMFFGRIHYLNALSNPVVQPFCKTGNIDGRNTVILKGEIPGDMDRIFGEMMAEADAEKKGQSKDQP